MLNPSELALPEHMTPEQLFRAMLASLRNIERLNDTARTKPLTILPTVMLTSTCAAFPFSGQPYPVPVNLTGSGANSGISLSFPTSNSERVNYITGLEVTGAGATAASIVTVTLNGLYSGITMQWDIAIPAGVTTPITPLVLNFTPPISGGTIGAGNTLTVPAFGAGNTNAKANLRGYQLTPYNTPSNTVTTVVQSWNVPVSFRVDKYLVFTDTPTWFSIKSGSRRDGPYYAIAGVNVFEIDDLILAGNEIQITDIQTPGATVRALVSGSYEPAG